MPKKITAQPERHVLSLLVDNEAGTLGRVTGLFSGRGYNIHSLTVAEIEDEEHLSRITITTFALQQKIDHIITLLEKLIPVHKVVNLTQEKPFVERGLILIKIKAVKDKRNEIIHITDSFGAAEVDTTDSSFVFELTDIPTKLDEFIEVLKPFGIIELVRTGITAIARGPEGF